MDGFQGGYEILIDLALDDMLPQTACIRCQIPRQGLHIVACCIGGPPALLWIDIAGTKTILTQ